MAFLEQVAIFLAAAVVVVPLARRAGMGSVLGYMLAGLIVGPWALDLVDDEREILHLAELGVVFLLFVIGLELQPRRLWAMRRAVFGLGGGQVALTALVLAGLAFALGLPLEAAVVAGLALSLSSTAFALQALAERNELTTRHGRLSFSILLFQDLAVIPILALLPLLAPASGGAGDGVLWLDMAKAVGMIALVVLGGRYLLRHVLRLVARFGTHEVFTATALLTVVGVALLMELVGLSMALGAFLAGVLLADSEYRHELEADIEPFKGLLLGLFFMAVGMTVNIGLVIETPLTVLGLAAGLMLVKMLCLIAVARVDTANWRTIRGTAVALSQGGEFAFVIVALGVSSALMDGRTADLLIVAVTLSMAATPLAFRAGDWLNAPPRTGGRNQRTSGISRRRTGSSSPGSAGSARSSAASCACAASASPRSRPARNRSISCAASATRSTTAMRAASSCCAPRMPTRPCSSCWRSRTWSARLRRRGRCANTFPI